MTVMVTVALPVFSAVPLLIPAIPAFEAAAAAGGLSEIDAALAAGGTEAS